MRCYCKVVDGWLGEPKDIRKYKGFVYIIYSKKTNKSYIGKKLFWNNVRSRYTRKPTKKEKDRLQNYIDKGHKDKAKAYKKKLREKYKGLTAIRVSYRESDWRDYWGSCKELHNDIEKYGKTQFTRTILECYKTKAECNYYEIKEQISRDVLGMEDSRNNHKYYNGVINIRLKGNRGK